MQNKILIIDDDTRLRNLLGKYLADNNFEVVLAKDTNEADNFLANEIFDLLIVDVMMPNENGFDFTHRFRQKNQTPIIMLTARGEPDDRIKGLENGADDYMPKPFEPKELLLRINNILRRKNSEIKISLAKNIVNFGDFTFNLSDLRLKKFHEFIHLTENDARILKILAQHQGEVVSRNSLSEQLGGIDERSIDVSVTRLRKKIESNPKQPHYIQTIRNHGYILHD
ncbi:MAG: response regulator [Alphaproteobacteria bacterium]